jgi:hypothetical protein
VILAGATFDDPVERVVTGLRAAATEHLLRLVVVDVRGPAAGATLTMRAPEPNAPGWVPIHVALDDAHADEHLAQLLDASAAELVVFVGPPLTEATTAAVLARHTDGLVLVAAPGATARARLADAAAAARTAGCPILGLIAVRADVGPRAREPSLTPLP